MSWESLKSWLITYDPNPTWMMITLHVVSVFATVIFGVGMGCIFFVKSSKRSKGYRNLLGLSMVLNYISQCMVTIGTMPVVHVALAAGFPLGILQYMGMSSLAQLIIGVIQIAAAGGCTILLFLYRRYLLIPQAQKVVLSYSVFILAVFFVIPTPLVTFLYFTVNVTDCKWHVYERNPELTEEMANYWGDETLVINLNTFNMVVVSVIYFSLAVVLAACLIFALVLRLTWLMRSSMLSETTRRMHKQFSYSLIAQTAVQYFLFFGPGLLFAVGLFLRLPLQGPVQLLMVSYSMADPAGIIALIWFHKDYKIAIKRFILRGINIKLTMTRGGRQEQEKSLYLQPETVTLQSYDRK